MRHSAVQDLVATTAAVALAALAWLEAVGGAGPAAGRFADKSANAVPVDIELVLAVDVSYSMDPGRAGAAARRLYRGHHLARFLHALREGMHGQDRHHLFRMGRRQRSEDRRALAADRRAGSGRRGRRRDRPRALSARLAHLDRGRAACLRGRCSTTAASAACAASSTCPATAPTTTARWWRRCATRCVAQRHHHQRPADHAQAAEYRHHRYRQSRRLLRGLRDRRPGRLRHPDPRPRAIQGSDPHQAGAGDRRPRAGARAWCRPRPKRRAFPAPSASRCGRTAGAARPTQPDATALALELRHQLDVRRIAELIDRRHARRAGSRRRPGCGRRARSVAGLHDTATTVGTLLAASSRACASRALARRIEHDGVEALELGRLNGRRNRSRTLASTGFRPCVVRGGALQRRDRVGVAVDRGDAGALGEPQRERADAGEQIGDALAPPHVLDRPAAPTPPRPPRSPAGRRRAAARTAARPILHRRRRAAGRPSRRGASGARAGAARRPAASAADPLRRQRPGAAHVDVEAGIGSR